MCAFVKITPLVAVPNVILRFSHQQSRFLANNRHGNFFPDKGQVSQQPLSRSSAISEVGPSEVPPLSYEETCWALVIDIQVPEPYSKGGDGPQSLRSILGKSRSVLEQLSGESSPWKRTLFRPPHSAYDLSTNERMARLRLGKGVEDLDSHCEDVAAYDTP
jgi:hypothetical protein